MIKEEEGGDLSSLKRKHGVVGDSDGINKNWPMKLILFKNIKVMGVWLLIARRRSQRLSTITRARWSKHKKQVKATNTSSTTKKKVKCRKWDQKDKDYWNFYWIQLAYCRFLSNQSKKKMEMRDNKEGQIKSDERRSLKVKFKLHASVGASAINNDRGMKKTEITSNEKKLL